MSKVAYLLKPANYLWGQALGIGFHSRDNAGCCNTVNIVISESLFFSVPVIIVIRVFPKSSIPDIFHKAL